MSDLVKRTPSAARSIRQRCTRLRDQGISYNRFHTTSICSPTRASLLTGRNHQRVGNGTIAERAVDWDGYTGVIPKTSATIPEVLHHYGYKSAAFGKWHNTPADQTTAMGPFDRWPTGHGFDYFYGFLAGETSQWEPRLFENLTPVEPPHDEKYHLTEDLADTAIAWLRRHRAYSPDKPFFLYWATGGAHGPHHVSKEWTDKYKGKFDDGWDAYRTRFLAAEDGLDSGGHQITPRAETMPVGQHPRSERAFQWRLMEVYAGFVEHTDAQAGKLIDELDRLGLRDNTIVFYIFGDNGASAEGQNGTISELLAQNGIPNTIQQQLAALEGLADSTLSARQRPTTCITPPGRGPATRRFSTPSSSPRTSAAPVTRWSFPGPEHQARPRPTQPVPARQRHRADSLRHPRHQAAADGEWLQTRPR